MMDGFSVEYVYENGMHLDYSQLYMHPRGLKKLANGQWFTVFGQKGALDIEQETAEFHEMDATVPRDILPPAIKDAKENAMADFFACIRESRAVCRRARRRDRGAYHHHGTRSNLQETIGHMAGIGGGGLTTSRYLLSAVGLAWLVAQSGAGASDGFTSLMPKKEFDGALDHREHTGLHWRVRTARSSAWANRTDSCAARSCTRTTFSVPSGAFERKVG